MLEPKPKRVEIYCDLTLIRPPVEDKETPVQAAAAAAKAIMV